MAVLRTIWIARNEKSFNSKAPNWTDLVDNIKIKVAVSVKHSFNPIDYSIHDFVHCLDEIKSYKVRSRVDSSILLVLFVATI